MSWLRRPSWSPYVVGALIGVLSWLAFATADHPLGVSTAFVRAAGLIETPLGAAEGNRYFRKFPPRFDWEVMLVVGVFLGALVSSRLSGERSAERVPALWARRFGPGAGKRYRDAFLAGVIMMFGARLAGGCTSGHGISGSLQLALSGWVFFLTLFAAGVAAAFLLYGREREDV